MIERDVETALLGRLHNHAASGRGSLAAIEGPAGMGKSRLMAHVRQHAARSGWKVLDARCTPASTAIPYCVMRDWFGTLAHRSGAGSAAFDGPGRKLLQLDDGPSIGDVAYGARWAFEDLSTDQPVLLLVDDLHWADTASLEALELLAGMIEQLAVLIVVSVRSGEPAAAPDTLRRLLGASRGLSPQPLSRGAVAELVRCVRPQATDADIDDMHRTSGGVPFYVTEMLASEGLPESVVGSVNGRIDRLTATGRRTAQAICVLGDQATVGAVAQLAELGVDSVASDVAALTAAHVLTSTGGKLGPAQPIVCECVMARLSLSDASQLQARAAGVLQGRGASRAIVARHLLPTLPGTDRDVRALLAEQGEMALASGAPEAAVPLLERAIDEGPLTADDVELLSAAARAYAATRRIDDALARWERAGELAVDDETRSSLKAETGDALMMAGRHQEAEAAFGALVTQRPRTLARMVHAGLLNGDAHDYLHDQLDRVLAQPAGEDTHDDRIHLAAGAALLSFAGDDAERARDLAVRAAGGGRLIDEESLDGAGLYLTSSVLEWTSAFIEGEGLLTSAIEEASSPTGLTTALGARAQVRLRMGLVTEALQDVTTALAQVDANPTAHLAELLAAQIEGRVARGELDQAAAHVEELEHLTHVPGSTGAIATYALAELASAQGTHERAAQLYAEVGRLVSDRLDNPAILPWRAGESLALIRMGDARTAVDLARENLERARRFGAPYALAVALRAVAAVDASIDRIAMLREALEELRKTQAPRLEAQIATDLAGMVLLSHGMAQSSEVVSLLRRAESYASFQELRPLADRVHRLLERIGEPAKKSSAETLSSLTQSERRVADLAAAGYSNRQIAQHLYVTVKAVEWHLSNVYRKLGIRSRTRLPALLNVPPPRAGAELLEEVSARSA